MEEFIKKSFQLNCATSLELRLTQFLQVSTYQLRASLSTSAYGGFLNLIHPIELTMNTSARLLQAAGIMSWNSTLTTTSLYTFRELLLPMFHAIKANPYLEDYNFNYYARGIDQYLITMTEREDYILSPPGGYLTVLSSVFKGSSNQ